MSKQMKPYRLDDRKAAKTSLTEIDLAQWKELILTHVKADENWTPLVNLTWDVKTPNRGLAGDTAAQDAVKLEAMLAFVATYAPSSVFREITQRCKSLAEVWNVVRKWAGIRASGAKHLTYNKLRKAFDPNGSQSHQEYYYALRDAKEDCLITRTSAIKFNGAVLAQDEDLTPCLEADVMVDWLDAIGGSPLVDHVFRAYSKELEGSSLADLQERISDNLTTLIAEAEASVDGQASIKKAFARTSIAPKREQREQRERRERNSSRRSSRPSGAQSGATSGSSKSCPLCKAKGRDYKNHNIAECFLLTTDDRNAIVKVHAVFMDDTDKEDGEDESNKETEEENSSSSSDQN